MHAFFDKHEVSAEDREDSLLSLLGKAAKSTCIIKAHVLIDAIMDARLFKSRVKPNSCTTSGLG